MSTPLTVFLLANAAILYSAPIHELNARVSTFLLCSVLRRFRTKKILEYLQKTRFSLFAFRGEYLIHQLCGRLVSHQSRISPEEEACSLLGSVWHSDYWLTETLQHTVAEYGVRQARIELDQSLVNIFVDRILCQCEH